MKNKKLFALLVLLVLVLACANPLAPAADQPANVETIVAATLSALTAGPSNGGAAPATPQVGDSPSSLLPRSMYYLANDAAQLSQIFRLETDGKTVTQLTFEPSNVDEFDISQADGSVVYISNNQIFLANADGSNRRMIFDAGPQNENDPFLTRVSSVVFSPNGQTVAFGHQGLNFYAIASGQTNRVLDDRVEEPSSGLFIPGELYRPELFSGDGSKLIITLGYYEGASMAIYYMNGGALVRLDNGISGIICCGDYSLSADGSTLYSGNPYSGMFAAGLWRVDTGTGNAATLLGGNYENDPVEAADNPFIAPDGQLYYFYASTPAENAFGISPELQLVRSAADGVSGRTLLRPETFANMNEALWAPNASFVIVANAPNDQVYQGGEAQLYYTDGSPMIALLPYAQSMKWGP